MADLPNTSNQFFPTFFSTLANHYAKKSASNHHYGPTKTTQYTTEWDVDWTKHSILARCKSSRFFWIYLGFSRGMVWIIRQLIIPTRTGSTVVGMV